MIIPIMAGYPSNLAKEFSLTEQFPQHILPLLALYNAQWWGYESLTAIVLACLGDREIRHQTELPEVLGLIPGLQITIFSRVIRVRE